MFEFVEVGSWDSKENEQASCMFLRSYGIISRKEPSDAYLY